MPNDVAQSLQIYKHAFGDEYVTEMEAETFLMRKKKGSCMHVII
jgi:hypothetical protein